LPITFIQRRENTVMKPRNLSLIGGLIGFLTIHSIGQPSSGDDINTQKGVETSVSQAYFKMGDLRLINNDWGSQELGCNSSYKIFINNDGSFGWEFNRATCGGATGNSQPDYPEVEFGIHPFGTQKDLVTSPDFSSTTLLPLQIKNINSASVTIDQMNIELQNAKSWNLNFEMWFATQHPITGSHNCAYAEIMVFWGWQDNRWPCDQEGTLNSGNNSYAFCHLGENWGCGWQYIQFRVNGGPMRNYSGSLDVKAILDWLVSNRGFSQDLWVSRMEIGSEIGDTTSGKVTVRSITFEVNGVSKSPEFYDPTAIRDKSPDLISRKRNAAIFPAGTSVEIVNMQGVRIMTQTGTCPRSVVELSRTLPKGIYLMYGIDRKGVRSKQAVVVPVL
jgi:hypothetical protein